MSSLTVLSQSSFVSAEAALYELLEALYDLREVSPQAISVIQHQVATCVIGVI